MAASQSGNVIPDVSNLTVVWIREAGAKITDISDNFL